MSSHVGYQHIRRVKLQVAAIQKMMVMSGESVKYRDEDVRVINVINQIKEELGISGDIKVYGSRLHGMASGRSDLDITLLGDMAGASQQETLKDFQPEFEKYFDNVTFIGNTRVPLLKATDGQTGIQIDFCIGNHLAIQKSELLRAYCHCDERVCELGTKVKEWAEARQLKGLHFLNSYTYMIMLVHYLQSCDPPVVPNLQAPSVVTTRSVSHNSQSIDNLLVGFFEYFGWRFNWEVDAVCPRLNYAKAPITKLSLDIKVKPSQWYIEDPLEPDSFNNAKCTVWGQKQLLQEMQETASNLRAGRPWRAAYVPSMGFLQCRTKLKISESALLREFKEFGITDVTSPRQPPGRDASVHLHFSDQECLQRALTKTGVCVEQCEMALHAVSSRLRRQASLHIVPLLETPTKLAVLQRLLNSRVSEGIRAVLNDGALRAGAPEFVPLGGVAHETGQLVTGLAADAAELVPLGMCHEIVQSATGSAGMGANAPEFLPLSTCLEMGEPATGPACMDADAPEFVPLRLAHETGQPATGLASMGFDAPEFVPLRMCHDTAESAAGPAGTSVDAPEFLLLRMTHETGQNITGLAGMVVDAPEFVPLRMCHETGEPATEPAGIGADAPEFVPLRRRIETAEPASGHAGIGADTTKFVPLRLAHETGQNMTGFAGMGVDVSEFAPRRMCHEIAEPATLPAGMGADAPEFVPLRMWNETGNATGTAGMGADTLGFVPLRLAHETGQNMTGFVGMGVDVSEFAPLHICHEIAEAAAVPAGMGADAPEFVPLRMCSETGNATGLAGMGADAPEFVPLRLAHETGQNMQGFVGICFGAPEFVPLRMCHETAEPATGLTGMGLDGPEFVPTCLCNETGEPETVLASMGADAPEFVPLCMCHEAGGPATGPAGMGADAPEFVPLGKCHGMGELATGLAGMGADALEFVLPLPMCHDTGELATGPASMGTDAPEFVPQRMGHETRQPPTGLASMGAGAPEFVHLSAPYKLSTQYQVAADFYKELQRIAWLQPAGNV